MITLHFSMVKHSQSRNIKYNYSTKSIVVKLDKLGWEHHIGTEATMVLFVSKSFPTEQEAIIGRREMEESLKPVGIRLDRVERE